VKYGVIERYIGNAFVSFQEILILRENTLSNFPIPIIFGYQARSIAKAINKNVKNRGAYFMKMLSELKKKK